MDVLNLLLTFILIGLIWTIQIVQYPSFRYIEKSQFKVFHEHHTKAITLIVLPLMAAEIGLAFYLASNKGWQVADIVPLTIVLLIWASTFWLQVPIHQRIGQNKNDVLVEKLINTNWIRTILWSLKGAWLVYYFG